MENLQPGSDRKVSEKPPFSKGKAWILLVIVLAVTGILTYNTKLAVEDEANRDFSFECNEIMAGMFAGLKAHAQLLRTGAAFFEASDSISRSEWKTFISHQKIEKNLPGVQGVGYAMIISGEDLKNHEQQIRSEGFPGYKVKPAGKREIYTSVVYLEPFSGLNLRAFGYDMYSEPIRRAAMEQARDSNNAALSGKVTLVQNTNTDKQAGTLLYVPIYRRGMPVNTMTERRLAIKGWIYSPYRMNDLMQGILGKLEIGQRKRLRLQIYDNDSIMPGALLFDSQSEIANNSAKLQTLKLKLPFIFNGKHWSLYFTQTAQHSSFYFHNRVLLVSIGGMAVSILIFLLALSLLNSRIRIRVITQQARQLKENLDKHVALYNAIPDAVIVTDSKTGRIEDINNKASEQYGYTHQEFTNINSSAISLFPEQSEHSGYKGHLFFHDQFHVKKDGTIFPVEISISAFQHDNSEKIIAVARDLTERIRAETDLNIKNEVFENSIAAQSIADNNGVITHVNRAFLNMWGFESATQAIDRTVDSMFAEQANAAEVFEALMTIDTWQGEFRAKRDDGSFFISRGYATSIRNEQGEIIGFQATNLDVTKEKEAESRLQEFKTAIDQAADGIAIAGMDMKIRFVNQAWAQMHGYAIEELIGCDISLFHTHEQYKNEVEPLIALSNQNGSHSGEEGHQHRDGTTFVTWMSNTILTDSKQNPTGYLGVAQDITFRKAAELELEKSKERYQTLVENVSDAIVVSIADQIAFANRKFFEMLGYAEQEVLSGSYLRCIHPDDQVALIENYQQLFEGKTLQKFPCRIITSNGSTRWVEFSSIIIEWDKHDAVLSFIADITERKMAGEALRASEALYKSTINASPDAIAVTDLNGRILMVSPSALPLLGCESTDDIMGQLVFEFLAPEEQELFNANFDLLTREKVKSPEAFSCLRKDGSKIDIEINGELVRDAYGLPTGFVFILRDITERKRAEELLRATLKEKEILLREVHHRVKNNLQVVSSLLNLQANKITDKTLKETLMQSRNRIRSIALVHEKLYQSGNFAEINIKEYTLSLIAELFRVYLADPDKIHIRTEIEDVNIPLMYAIPCGLILNEIISNSLKYAFPENHTFKIKPEIFIGLKTLPDKQLQFCAGDNGIGLPPDYQISDSASLGLYLIQILSTEQLDGKIEINTKKGTLFAVTFNPFQK